MLNEIPDLGNPLRRSFDWQSKNSLTDDSIANRIYIRTKKRQPHEPKFSEAVIPPPKEN